VLKAGSGWSTPFRGNVDNLVIGIGGVNTTFDFEPISAPGQHLHSELSRGLSGPHIPTDSDYTSGAIVHYDFSASAGYSNLLVVVDDTIASSSGDIAMNSPHTIMAAADAVFDGNVAVTNMTASVSALLTASDPASAYSDFLQSYLDRARAIGPDSVEAEVAIATFQAVDPYRDHDALVALDEALAGTVFVIDRFGGQEYTYYYSPDDYSSGGGGYSAAKTGMAKAPQLRRRHGRHYVPQELLDRKPRARIPSRGGGLKGRRVPVDD